MTVYDCFMYHGTDTDRRLLALRLAETAQVVDRWVLVESQQTHSGQPKPLHFSTGHRHDPEIAPYADRIIVVQVDLPHDASPTARENVQRAAIADGLYACGVQLEDWVLVSDLDEIPSADAIGRVLRAEYPGVYAFAQRLSYYYVNCVASNQPWHGTRMARWRDIPNTQVLRFLGGHNVTNGGWHLSYLGGTDEIRKKIEAYLHQEFNAPQFTAADHIAACLREGHDLFGREGMTFAMQPIDHTYPALISSDPRPFADWIAPVVQKPLSAPEDAAQEFSDTNLRQEVLG